ncbi:unnamed protein product [Phytophthora lilii]|uniref:Unnamed protein product n=1 Tax=Phytophthora lilii TaxID=2077276 RepID=A0A9W6THU0_9STRA|nr:unnamed protein product [Phytophthora lilii]
MIDHSQTLPSIWYPFCGTQYYWASMCGIALVVTPLATSSRPANTCNSPSKSPAASFSATSADCNHVPHSVAPSVSEKFDFELQRRLCQRGPDQYKQLTRRVAMDSNGENCPSGWVIAMHSAVLHLRGEGLTPQPVVDSEDNVLCWNGEVFGIDGDDVEDEKRLMESSDTMLLSEKLQAAGEKLSEMTTKDDDPVVEVLRRVRGPFAVAWLHEQTRRVYFAHDRFGRRSLLYRRWGSDDVDMVAKLAGAETTSAEFLQRDLARFVLSSVAIGDNDEDLSKFQELPAAGIYALDLRPRKSSEGGVPSYCLEFYPYMPLLPKLLSAPTSETPKYVFDEFGSKLPSPKVNSETDSCTQGDVNTLESSARALLIALSNAVGVRIRSIPARPLFGGGASVARIAVLFSGGLDSVVIAALTHFHVAAIEPVDLLTVCFDENSGFQSPDRQAAELSHAELCALFPERQWNLIKINVSRSELSNVQKEVLTLMAPCDTHMDFNIGAAFWFLSRGLGELKSFSQTSETVSMEKLNAFLTPQQAGLRELETEVAAFKLFDPNENSLLCPVHQCGRKLKQGCVLGICKSCCLKMQRAVNKLFPDGKEQPVDLREVEGYRAKLISMGVQTESHLDLLLDLLKSKYQDEQAGAPGSTHKPMLCCRVHRTKQEVVDNSQQLTSTSTTQSKTTTTTTYQTTARVVLVGIGADEQLAGYGRHRTALINGGEEALRSGLRLDLGRIWKRNLGRDDRCIAAHGREARFPFLDENVVSTIATFPTSSLCDSELPRGVGDKRALRVVAKTLGLRSCAGLAKRAIQFGSRIAKVSNSGSNRQTQGMNKFSRV